MNLLRYNPKSYNRMEGTYIDLDIHGIEYDSMVEICSRNGLFWESIVFGFLFSILMHSNGV